MPLVAYFTSCGSNHTFNNFAHCGHAKPWTKPFTNQTQDKNITPSINVKNMLQIPVAIKPITNNSLG
jgi:hypothetical protein